MGWFKWLRKPQDIEDQTERQKVFALLDRVAPNWRERLAEGRTVTIDLNNNVSYSEPNITFSGTPIPK